MISGEIQVKFTHSGLILEAKFGKNLQSALVAQSLLNPYCHQTSIDDRMRRICYAVFVLVIQT